jgi:hypothetical protein
MSSPLTDIESVSSHASEDSVSGQENEDGYRRSALWRSLFVLSQDTRAVNEHTVSSVPSANNPRPLRVMGDNAKYWVNDSGNIFTFKFPATLDLEGQYDRSGPYFNLPRTGVSC